MDINISAGGALFYQGPSMSGTFKTGDYLFSDPVPFHDIRCGDIIIYKKQRNEKSYDQLVHRVMRHCERGWITRGDNNPREDPEPVTPENLLGKIHSLERGGKTRRVRGGAVGLFYSRWLRAKRFFLMLPRSCLRLPYHVLRRSGWMKKIWRPEIREFHFQTPEGLLIKFCTESNCIASFRMESGKITCRKPYDLVLFPRIRELQKKRTQP